MDGAEPQKNRENKFSLVVVVVVRTRPRAIPLATITTKKSLHGFPLISHDAYGAPSEGPSGRGAPLLLQKYFKVSYITSKFVFDIWCCQKWFLLSRYLIQSYRSFQYNVNNLGKCFCPLVTLQVVQALFMNLTSNTVWHWILRVYIGLSTRYPWR